jgi:8-oxo-dGTP pyrophosphatase MutT (NUDIX family)
MEKPVWRLRASTFVVNTPYLRLRSDEVELPDGTIVPDYFVRESDGFVVVFALTPGGQVVLVRQYRYGSDDIHLELPAGMIDAGEDPQACARRELGEETGYSVERLEPIGFYYPEPVRSTSRGHLFVATGARQTLERKLDPTEAIEVELASVEEFRRMLADGTIDSGAAIASGYRALDYLDAL